MALTATELLKLNVKAEQMWQDSALALSTKPNTETAKAILKNQTATFKVFEDSKLDQKVAVTFLSMCGMTAEACVANCDIDEAEPNSGVKDYTPDICFKSGFKINEKILRTNQYQFEELFAKFSAQAIDSLDEQWSIRALAKMKTFAGANAYPSPFTYDSVNKTTNVPSAVYNTQMIAKLIQQMMLNEMGDAYFIDNGSLWEPFFNAQMNAGNLDGKGQASLIQQLNMTFDQFNFAKASISEDTFAISKGAIAMKTINKFEDAPRQLTAEGQMRYTMKSRSLPGVKYDVIHQEKCVGDDIFQTFRFISNGGIWLNPETCPVTVGGSQVAQTGVLSYSKV